MTTVTLVERLRDYVNNVDDVPLRMEAADLIEQWEVVSLVEIVKERDELKRKYQRAVWFLQDIAAMSRKVGSETAAHALAQLGEPRTRDGD